MEPIPFAVVLGVLTVLWVLSEVLSLTALPAQAGFSLVRWARDRITGTVSLPIPEGLRRPIQSGAVTVGSRIRVGGQPVWIDSSTVEFAVAAG
jgi:hypothetical protein